MSVRVAVILDRKGAGVVTIKPDTNLAEAAQMLVQQNIGALVVSSDGRTAEGIVSERDIVRRLAAQGTDALSQSVGEAMSTHVITCTRETITDDLMAMMTNSRIRHIPVVEGGELAGIVSIGDVVKSRMDELEIQARTLQEYVTGSSY